MAWTAGAVGVFDHLVVAVAVDMLVCNRRPARSGATLANASVVWVADEARSACWGETAPDRWDANQGAVEPAMVVATVGQFELVLEVADHQVLRSRPGPAA
ncbi:MAG: hypothetical protein VYE68_07505 [Acidobacteriota bacterium]|nr:hypothetical protein [Acidobacteriota bacterium]